MTTPSEPVRRGKREWTIVQWRRRFSALRNDGFTPEEAYELANWSLPLGGHVIRHMRQDRRTLLRTWRRAQLAEDEIDQLLERRYIDLGMKGQYIDEAWYVQKEAAA